MKPPRRRNRIDRVTTRTGDGGVTSLADGRRYAKHDARIELVGALDEANSALGVLAAAVGGDTAEQLAVLQSRLFDAGAVVATGASSVDWTAVVVALEADTEALNATLSPLKEFILPGGGRAAASAHLARSVARRAERAWWRAAEDAGELREFGVGAYLNRLSDYLFVLARTLADGERLWQPLRQ
jgi:cob(I)alamin adenosyltransferase